MEKHKGLSQLKFTFSFLFSMLFLLLLSDTGLVFSQWRGGIGFGIGTSFQTREIKSIGGIQNYVGFVGSYYISIPVEYNIIGSSLSIQSGLKFDKRGGVADFGFFNNDDFFVAIRSEKNTLFYSSIPLSLKLDFEKNLFYIGTQFSFLSRRRSKAEIIDYSTGEITLLTLDAYDNTIKNHDFNVLLGYERLINFKELRIGIDITLMIGIVNISNPNRISNHGISLGINHYLFL